MLSHSNFHTYKSISWEKQLISFHLNFKFNYTLRKVYVSHTFVKLMNFHQVNTEITSSQVKTQNITSTSSEITHAPFLMTHPTVTTALTFKSIDLLCQFFSFYITGVLSHALFCAWLLSFNNMLMKSIYVVAHNGWFFILSTKLCSILLVYQYLSICVVFRLFWPLQIALLLNTLEHVWVNTHMHFCWAYV